MRIDDLIQIDGNFKPSPLLPPRIVNHTTEGDFIEVSLKMSFVRKIGLPVCFAEPKDYVLDDIFCITRPATPLNEANQARPDRCDRGSELFLGLHHSSATIATVVRIKILVRRVMAEVRLHNKRVTLRSETRRP